MKRKVILLLSNPCISDPRVEFTAETLADAGFEAEILAWDRDGGNPDVEQRSNYLIRRFFVKSGSSIGLKQLFLLPLFYIKAFKYIKCQSACFAIHCNDFDTLPLGLFIKLFQGKKIIYDAHEIYCDMVFENRRFLRNLCLCIEKTLVRYVDIFFTVGETRLEWYVKNNYPKTPVVLGNWKSKLDISIDIEKEKSVRGISGKLLILYIGSLNKERNLVELVEAVGGDSRFHLYIGGSGSQKESILQRMGYFPNMEYIGYISDKALLDYYNKICDVIYYGLDMELRVSKTAVPNKMFEAIAYDKIFLCSPFGEALKLQQGGGGFIIIRDLKQQLNEIYKIMSDRQKRSELTVKNLCLNNKFNREKAAQIIIDSYCSLITADVKIPGSKAPEYTQSSFHDGRDF